MNPSEAAGKLFRMLTLRTHWLRAWYPAWPVPPAALDLLRTLRRVPPARGPRLVGSVAGGLWGLLIDDNHVARGPNGAAEERQPATDRHDYAIAS